MRLLFLLATVAACSDPPPPPAPAPVAPQPTEITAELVPAEGLTKLLTEAHHKPRIVNFWATWCSPCVAEVPTLTRFAKDHPEADVLLISVDVPSFHDKKVVPFLKKHKVVGPRNYQLDAKDPATTLLKTVPNWPDAIPVTLAIQPDGTITKQYNRAVDTNDLLEALAAAR